MIIAKYFILLVSLSLVSWNAWNSLGKLVNQPTGTLQYISKDVDANSSYSISFCIDGGLSANFQRKELADIRRANLYNFFSLLVICIIYASLKINEMFQNFVVFLVCCLL